MNLEEGCCCQFLRPLLRGVGVASAVWMLVRKDAGCFLVRSQGCGVCVCARERDRGIGGEKGLACRKWEVPLGDVCCKSRVFHEFKFHWNLFLIKMNLE